MLACFQIGILIRSTGMVDGGTNYERSHCPMMGHTFLSGH